MVGENWESRSSKSVEEYINKHVEIVKNRGSEKKLVNNSSNEDLKQHLIDLII